MALLEVKDLTIEFLSEGKQLSTVTGVSFHLERGELLALVGESGCGKSISCLALTRLLPPAARITSGKILLETSSGTVDLLQLSKPELRKVRGGEIAYIFQEPAMCLNPVMRVGDQIVEAIELHCPDIADPAAEAVDLLRQAGIPEPETRAHQYPHEMSGGMQQRVMIAMALASRPSILVADEPTTALDVTIQAQILDLLGKLRRERDMSIILVTHNLGIVAELADRVEVMYAGRVVEEAAAQDLIASPAHPYTKALLAAVPVLGEKKKELQTIPGIVPAPGEFPAGCRFCDRCSVTLPCCKDTLPPQVRIADQHFCACHAVAPGGDL
ncbi:MAG: ABC transporter ATP-binding protein [Lentisphaeria bacterium]|nr:ABC transporter ATP-binding protein [Lentisphaeria bacterium]